MTTIPTIAIQVLTPEQGYKLLDQEARRCLGISGEEFVRLWKERKFEGPEQTKAVRVAMLLPLAGHALS